MKTLTAGITALTLLGVAGANAQTEYVPEEATFLPKTGAGLVALIDGCDSPECFSYISGVINGITVYSYLIENPSPFCAGPEVRSNEIRDAVVGVVRDTPRLGRAAAPAAILTAFSRNWPCNTSSAEAVANDLDGAEAQEDLITYTDLDQVDMDQLLDFISRKSFSLSLGSEDAPLEKTLHVFLDPNCEYCSILADELDDLVAQGWRAMIYPISNISEESKGYAALQLAIRDSSSGAPEALFRHRAENKDISAAMEVAQQAGMPMPEVLQMLAMNSPYQVLEANNQAYEAFGATQAPTWILGDRIVSGITDADEILRIQSTMIGSPSPVANEINQGDQNAAAGADAAPEEEQTPTDPSSDTKESATTPSDSNTPLNQETPDTAAQDESRDPISDEDKALRPGIKKEAE